MQYKVSILAWKGAGCSKERTYETEVADSNKELEQLLDEVAGMVNFRTCDGLQITIRRKVFTKR